MMLKRIMAMLAVLLMNFIGLSKAIISSGGKPFPGLENLPRSFWHELSSPFTEVYEEESFATETGATPEPRPFFEDPDSNITVQLGAQVYLHCRVQNLQTRTVSWVRRRGDELHLLTFGQQTYSSDSRFSLDSEKPNNWRLRLSSATERDTGVYECQVSAHPPLIRTVHLTVSAIDLDDPEVRPGLRQVNLNAHAFENEFEEHCLEYNFGALQETEPPIVLQEEGIIEVQQPAIVINEESNPINEASDTVDTITTGLLQYMKKKSEGKEILKAYNKFKESKKLLSKKVRSKLVRLVIRREKDWVLKDINETEQLQAFIITQERFKILANEIASIFEGESEATYYTPFKQEGSNIVPASGKLWHHFNYTKDCLRASELLRRKKSEIPALVYSENDLNHIQWLSTHLEPWAEVTRKWIESAKIRRHLLLNQDITVHEYIGKFPCLKVQKAKQLYFLDFSALYPKKSNLTKPQWKIVKECLIDHLSTCKIKCLDDAAALKVLQSGDLSEVPKVEIVDEHGATAGDKFYKAGSTIELKCVVSKVPHPSGYVTWTHGFRTLNYDTIRGGISVKTDMGAEGAVSRLYIANANKKDSGNYSCALADVAATTVSVHVLNGENPAAMQHGASQGLRSTFLLTALLTLTSVLR